MANANVDSANVLMAGVVQIVIAQQNCQIVEMSIAVKFVQAMENAFAINANALKTIVAPSIQGNFARPL